MDMKTGIAKAFVAYVPGWHEYVEAVLVHEWMHHVDDQFYGTGWERQWNLAWLHCGRDWNSRPPMNPAAKWMVGYMAPLAQLWDGMDYYRYTLSVNITPQMWGQAHMHGIEGERGGDLD